MNRWSIPKTKEDCEKRLNNLVGMLKTQYPVTKIEIHKQPNGNFQAYEYHAEIRMNKEKNATILMVDTSWDGLYTRINQAYDIAKIFMDRKYENLRELLENSKKILEETT